MILNVRETKSVVQNCYRTAPIRRVAFNAYFLVYIGMYKAIKYMKKKVSLFKS